MDTVQCEFVEWVYLNDEWSFSDGLWHKQGWRSRNTNDLFRLFLKEQKPWTIEIFRRLKNLPILSEKPTENAQPPI